MLKDNLVMLRKIHGYSQEEIAEKVGISRQAYAKWEKGATIPDVEKCAILARFYETSIDELIKTTKAEGIGMIPPAPKGKYLWDSVTVGDRGQIVIPKEARDKYGLNKGQKLIVVGDETGIALIPEEKFRESMEKAMELLYSKE